MSSKHALASWPAWASRWLGYRAQPPPKPRQYTIIIWAFIGAFCGLSVLQAVFGHAEYFIERGVPAIVASYGASAVLAYAAVEAPLAQPRAIIGGHFLSALTGVIINTLFGLMRDPERLAQYQWLNASLSTSVAIVVMLVTETVHPPAGATALLPATNPSISSLGWYYLPVVLLSSALIVAVALVTNNIERRYPMYWIKPLQPAVIAPSPALGGPEPRATPLSFGSPQESDNGPAVDSKATNGTSMA